MKRKEGTKLAEERKKLQDLCKAYALLKRHGVLCHVPGCFDLDTKAELVEWYADPEEFERRRLPG